MTEDNIVRIYIAAFEQVSPDAVCAASETEWEAIYEFAEKMIQEVTPLLDAYEIPIKK